MTTVQTISDFLDEFAPPRLAEQWDNVGLLVGNRHRSVRKLMTCLTVTPASAGEAVSEGVQLVVAHHPLPFHPLKQLTSDTVAGQLLLRLIAADIAIYSPHTAFDSAANGINQSLAEGLGLLDIQPLLPLAGDPDGLGAGRYGQLAQTARLHEVSQWLKAFLMIDGLQQVGADDLQVSRIAVACGSAGQFLQPARQAGCQALITGETSFHTCLEAEANGVGLLLPGHYASERFALERLARVLDQQFPDVEVWASRQESDPLRWID